MKRMRVCLSMILLALFSSAYSQQGARQSNPLLVNQGYTGSQEALSVTGIVRSQWVGFVPIISLPSITAGVARYTAKTVMLRNGAGHDLKPYHGILQH